MNAGWSDGYVTDVAYTHGYYHELHPDQLRLACIVAGFLPPSDRPLRYLELGFGQGVSINIHAAALDGEFWGTDFNPSQAAFARSLGQASGSGVRLLDDSFADFARRDDVPGFDIIALHGIWTWVSDESRRLIVDIASRKLNVGGFLYTSYNCRPGWAAAEPLRHLMTLHAELAPKSNGTLANIESALAFCKQIVDGGALYFKQNPAVVERLGRAQSMNRNYLAHEYFNRNWELTSFSDMTRWLEPAKLTYAASAHMLDHIDSINLPPDAQKLLAATPHPVLRETIRDYFVNQQFRRDLYIRGPQRLTPAHQAALLREQAFVLTRPAEDISMKIVGALGEATLQASIYEPLIEVLAAAGSAPMTVAELVAHTRLKHLQLPQIVQAMLVLMGGGNAFPARRPTAEAARRCASLNAYVCHRAAFAGDLQYLASPVTGSAIHVDRIQQLLIGAMSAGVGETRDQVKHAWSALSAQGEVLSKDGKPIEGADANLAELERQAVDFHRKRLPILRTLGVVKDAGQEG